MEKFHGIPWNFSWNCMENSMKNFHEKKSVKWFCGIPWNSMEFHGTEVDGIPWNEFRELTEFDGIRFRQGSLPRPDTTVSFYARSPICPEACRIPKTGLTLTLTLANTNPYPNSEALDVMCREMSFPKPVQIGPRAKKQPSKSSESAINYTFWESSLCHEVFVCYPSLPIWVT
jgi:hypothetical protein